MQSRLETLVKNYAGDIQKTFDDYKQACARYNVEPKRFLSDASLYPKSSASTFSVKTIVERIEKETEKITPKEVRKEAKKQREQEKEEARRRKRQKRDEEAERYISTQPPCTNCKERKGYLFLYAKACGNASWRYPSGKEGEGYMPSFTNITDSDGVITEICVNCGVIKGFDPVRLQEEIAEEENDDE
eukprot:TRINITY_DN13002_c0_g1_i1.p1 TRINITY_DN13002_c0_g1~~TRINITY_DN13002_c0_g1_i1.p1  ORF type:complete len:188 (-),score=64.55 TRINITY_DN13002_c0_g1_i1:38-601(-)